MKYDISPPQSGKTTRAVEWVKAGRKNGLKDSSDRILVVVDEGRKKVFMGIYDLGYHEIESITTIIKYYPPTLRKKELWIDELSEVFHRLIPFVKIHCASDSEYEE